MIRQLIERSMERNKPLQIIYQSSKGITQRSIKVKSIEGSRIRAYCYTKGEMRTFIIDQILAADIDLRPRNNFLAKTDNFS